MNFQRIHSIFRTSMLAVYMQARWTILAMLAFALCLCPLLPGSSWVLLISAAVTIAIALPLFAGYSLMTAALEMPHESEASEIDKVSITEANCCSNAA